MTNKEILFLIDAKIKAWYLKLRSAEILKEKQDAQIMKILSK
jgi:hypothetical protein